MADERAGEIGHAYGWHRIVAKLPVAAVKRIHVFALARDHADRLAATNDFAVGAQIGTDAEQALGAGRLRAAAGHDLGEDPQRAALQGGLAPVLTKGDRAEIRA